MVLLHGGLFGVDDGMVTGIQTGNSDITDDMATKASAKVSSSGLRPVVILNKDIKISSDGEIIQDVTYKVEHYKQDANLSTYTLADTETLKGPADTVVTANPKTYEGYTENTNISQRIPTGVIVADGSLVLKLYYDRNTYTVTLNTNGGTINTGNITQYTYGIGATLPTNVTKPGHTFKGWYENTNFTGTPITNISNTEIGNKTYYAKWEINQYTVTFKDGNDIVKTQTLNHGTGATAPELTKPGYTLSWDKAFNNVTSNLTVNAIWTPNTNTKYTVKHYKQEGNTTKYTLAETQELTAPTDTLVNAIPRTYTGYVENLTAKERIPSGIVKGDGSLELILIYDTVKLTVTFKDGGTVVDTQTIIYGENATAPQITKPGYTLTWDKPLENITEDQTINAIWTPNEGIPYKIEHYIQNTDLTTYTLKETDNLTGTTDVLVNAIPKNYQGFSQNTQHPERIPNGLVAEDGSLILKLYYDRQTYEITYETNEGTIEDENYETEYTYGIGATLPTNVAKDGYTFGGWYESSNFTGTPVTQINSTDTGAKTYYANWIAKGNIPYKVLHYKQQDTGYVLADVDNLNAPTNTVVTAIPKNYEGYIENLNYEERVQNGTVVADGSLTLKLYYDTIKLTVVFKDGETVVDTQTINYGEGAIAPTITKDGYTLSWDKDFSKVTSNLEINAVWTKIPQKQAQYKIEHYIPTKQGEYILKETENLTGNIGEEVQAQAKPYEEYILDETNTDMVKTGKIEEGKELVLKLYYNYKKFEIIFKDGDKEVGRVEVIYGGTVKPPVLTKPGYILSWDKDLNNITKNQTINAIWKKEVTEDKKPTILPQTGEETITLGAIMGLLGIAIIYFIKYRDK